MARSATYKLEVKGLLTQLRSISKGGQKPISKRMIVSPQWIQLYYLVSEDKFDHNLWVNLSQIEKNWLIEVCRKIKLDNRNLNNANNQEATKLVDRLQLIEGSISAGNNNEQMINEFYEILDQLKERHHLTSYIVNNLKRNFDKILNKKKTVMKLVDRLI